MPRDAKGPRLWRQPASRGKDGSVRAAVWVIRDGATKRSTGVRAAGRGSPPREALDALAAYIAARHAPARERGRRADAVLVADVLNIYTTDIAPKHARPKETGLRIRALLGFWGDKTLADVTGQSCRRYAEHRGSPSAARRELEELRAAINHHRSEGLCTDVVSVVLPDKSPPRERWLTRSEAARLIWAAWRYREVQKGMETDRRSRRHVARFILVALYTGTRASAVCAAALGPTPGAAWIDLERGIFYRRAEGERETKKRKPPVRLPSRLLAHLRRWKKLGQRYAVEWRAEPVLAVRKAFQRARDDAGLDEAVTPHVLRHTAATWLMHAGTDRFQAAGFLGMSVETLERVYGHHHPDHQADAVENIARRGLPADRNGRTKREQDASNVIEIAGNKRFAQ